MGLGHSNLGTLTELAVDGQPAAIETLLRQIRPMVVRYCRARLTRISGHYHAADDVAQEVCIAVVSALPRYQDMGRPFASFVFGIASHKVADAMRSAARLAIPTEDLPDGPDDRPGPEETAVAYLEAERARALLARLPGESARAARAQGPVRAVSRGDRPRPRHVGWRGARRSAPGAGQAARHRGRGISRGIYRLASRASRRSQGDPRATPRHADRGLPGPTGSLLPRGRDPGPGGNRRGRRPVPDDPARPVTRMKASQLPGPGR